MKQLAINKTKKELYKVLQTYLLCLDNYFSTIHLPKTDDDISQEIIQKFILTSRQLQSILQSLEEM